MKVLEKVVEDALVGGLVLSAALLLGGILTESGSALGWGLVLLMLTPVARVTVLTIGLLVQREWLFGAVSFFVLAVLGSGIFVAGFATWPHSLPFR